MSVQKSVCFVYMIKGVYAHDCVNQRPTLGTSFNPLNVVCLVDFLVSKKKKKQHRFDYVALSVLELTM